MDKSINISDRDFHGRIVGKYQKGKKNLYDFPLMIFYKNPGQLLSQKINLNVLLQFNISKKITSQYILKTSEGIKSLLEWFRIERYVPKKHKVNSLASRSKDIPVFISFVFEKINSALNRISYPLVLNSEKSNFNSNSYIKSSFQTHNQITKISTENILNKDYTILSVDNSVSWDYKFLFHNELPAILQNEYNKSSRSDRNYHVILPHVNLLLNTISANNIVSYTKEFSKEHPSEYGFDHSFPQADLMVKEFVMDKDNHFSNFQNLNDQIKINQVRKIHGRNTADQYVSIYDFPAVLQYMDTIQKNMPEMIFSHSKSFPTRIKHNKEKEYRRTLSFKLPSIIRPVLKDEIKGQTGVNLEHLIKPDRSTEASIENHNLQFKTNIKIEEEMENIKRIAQEAKQTVIESVKIIQTSHEEEMNRKINISQLSDQVYRLLDRKITIEKERRGII
jgi:hypothetical protein